MSDLFCGIAEDGGDAASFAIGVDEGVAFNTILALPSDGETGISLLQMNRLRVTISGQAGGKMIGDVEQPCVSGLGGEQDQLADGDHAQVVVGSFVLDVANLVGEAEALAVHHLGCFSALDGSGAHSHFSPSSIVRGMELFIQLFSDLLDFVYHCFDRIVINGYLSGLSRPEQVVYFFRQVLGIPVVSKEVLSQRTNDYRSWVEAYARNQGIAMEWAEKGVRKEEYVMPDLRRMEKRNVYGVYSIFKSMELGRTFRISVPKFPTEDPNYRILAHQQSRFTHYYFYIRDEVLGPIVVRMASFFPFHATYWLNGHSFMEQELKRKQIGFRKSDNAFLAVDDVAQLQAAADRLSPAIIRKQLDYWTLIVGPKFSKKERGRINLSRFYAINQIEYCRNFIFKRRFPIHKIFERSCEIGLWRLTANRISEIFGVRLNKRLQGKLATVIDQIEYGHHVLRAYWKHAFLKQYEKFCRYLRNELVSNNLHDFGLKKGLDHLDAVRKRFQIITDRFAGFQAQSLNVHVDFPLLQRIALPVTIGTVRVPGIKIQDTRVIRLLEVLLHGGNTVGGWTAKQIHEAVLTTFQLSANNYGLNQLRYDLRKIKGHGLLERDGRRYAYRLTAKGVDVALLFLFFHKRLCGPLANSRFHHRPDPASKPNSKLEAAYHKADKAIENIVDLLRAA